MLNRCRMKKKLKKESNQNLGNKKRFKSKWKERRNSLNLMKNKKGKNFVSFSGEQRERERGGTLTERERRHAYRERERER